MAKTTAMHDNFGNFTGFPDDVIGPLTMKGLLGKWVTLKLSDIRYAVTKYHMSYRNIDAGDANFVLQLFADLDDELFILTPVLEDLTASHLYGFDNIVEAMYGPNSDEVYLVREYRTLAQSRNEWKACDMWKLHAGKDARLYNILTSNQLTGVHK